MRQDCDTVPIPESGQAGQGRPLSIEGDPEKAEASCDADLAEACRRLGRGRIQIL